MLLDDQTELRAPLVISDAGLANTTRLLPRARAPSWQRALATVSRSSSYFSLCLGFKHTDQELGLTGTNLWLPDAQHDLNTARLRPTRARRSHGVRLVPQREEDPDWARRFPGRATVDVIAMARFDWYERWKATRWQKRGDDYEAFKREVAERLLEVVFDCRSSHSKVDVMEATTPPHRALLGARARRALRARPHARHGCSGRCTRRAGCRG